MLKRNTLFANFSNKLKKGLSAVGGNGLFFHNMEEALADYHPGACCRDFQRYLELDDDQDL